ncbi:PAS domain-containing protein, partial [Couchioplanes caeruleus]
MTAHLPLHAEGQHSDGRATGPPVAAPALLRAALDASAEAIVLCAADDDTILLVNPAASELLPDLRPGDSAAAGTPPGLGRAIAEGAETFTDEYAGRQVHGRRRPLDEDHYAWYVRDCTDEMRRAEEFRAERARTSFLAEAGRRLSASLHQRRCLRTTVDLA